MYGYFSWRSLRKTFVMDICKNPYNAGTSVKWGIWKSPVGAHLREVLLYIFLLDKPYFNDFNSTIEIIENQLFNITLQANAYPLPISYTWFHPEGRQLMNDQLNIFINQGELIIKNIQRNDLGIYRCIATNSIGNTEVNFTLNVLCM